MYFLGIPVQKDVFLVNKEQISLKYNFNPGSLLSSGLDQGLTLKPMSGSLRPNTEEVIQ